MPEVLGPDTLGKLIRNYIFCKCLNRTLVRSKVLEPDVLGKLHFSILNYTLYYILHHKLSYYTLCTLNYHTLNLNVIFTVIFNKVLLHVTNTYFLLRWNKV